MGVGESHPTLLRDRRPVLSPAHPRHTVVESTQEVVTPVE